MIEKDNHQLAVQKLIWSIKVPLLTFTPVILFPDALNCPCWPLVPPNLADLTPIFVSNWIALTKLFEIR